MKEVVGRLTLQTGPAVGDWQQSKRTRRRRCRRKGVPVEKGIYDNFACRCAKMRPRWAAVELEVMHWLTGSHGNGSNGVLVGVGGAWSLASHEILGSEGTMPKSMEP